MEPMIPPQSSAAGAEPTPGRVLATPASSGPHRAAVQAGVAAPTAPPQVSVDIESLITEDDTPVDNMPSEKQQRLLTEPLYSSWAGPGAGRPFLAAANVGVFPEARNPAIVPDVFLSLDVQVADNFWDKRHRSYFVWEFGKPPDLVLEIVSNREGNEVGRKRLQRILRERMGVGYYVIYDPSHGAGATPPRGPGTQPRGPGTSPRGPGTPSGGGWPTICGYTGCGAGATHALRSRAPVPGVEVGGLRLWEGEFEGVWWNGWLRWVDGHDVLIPTGREQRRRADQERNRAPDQERAPDTRGPGTPRTCRAGGTTAERGTPARRAGAPTCRAGAPASRTACGAVAPIGHRPGAAMKHQVRHVVQGVPAWAKCAATCTP